VSNYAALWPGITNSSSAWTFAPQAEDNADLDENLGGHDIAVGINLLAKLIWTEKRE